MKTSTIFYIILITTLLLPATSPAQWARTNGPYGGYVQCYAVSPNGAGGTNLFAGTYRVSRDTGLPDNWTQIVGNGFGSANNIDISEFVGFNGFLYAGTAYPGGITQLWRSSSGDAGTWSKITNYAPSLVGVTTITSFATTTLGGGYIWLGAGGPPGAAVIYRSQNGTDWTLISKKGFGTLTNVVPAPNMVLFKGPNDTTEYLYAGAGSHGFTRPPTAGQVWRTAFNNNDSTQWTKLIDFATIDTTVKTITYFYVWNNNIYFATDGRGQLWESTDGIRFTKNSSSPSFIACIVDFQGYLYVTTNNSTTGGQLWRTSDGVNWQMITNNAFGKGSPVVELHSMHTSFGKIWITGYTDPTTAVLSPIWRSDDGINFVQSNADGFGDANNKGANPVTIGYRGSQYFGGPNSVTGAQMWRLGPPLIPTLLSPPDNATGVSTTPTLSWAPVTGAATYRLQVSTSSTFTITALDDSTITSTSRQVGSLLNNTSYFWRVDAKNAVGVSSFSDARSFTTVTTSVEQINNTIPASYSLEQNFPNPFNSATEIRYALPSRSHVILEIISQTGQQVATLVNQEQEAGYYRATWISGSMSSGVYFYRLTAGSFIETKKLILLR